MIECRSDLRNMEACAFIAFQQFYNKDMEGNIRAEARYFWQLHGSSEVNHENPFFRTACLLTDLNWRPSGHDVRG